MARILKAFPKFDKNQLEILKERFKELKFTDKRILDAVNNVIDTYQGWDKLPNLANFLQFDKTERLYTHNELLEKLNAGNKEIFKNSEMVEIDGKKLWKLK